MTKSITQFLVVALFVGSFVGCSSLNSMTQGSIPRPYAGTSAVGAGISQTMSYDEGLEELGKLFLPIFALDFVGSAALDTAILPVTLTKSVFFAETSRELAQASP